VWIDQQFSWTGPEWHKQLGYLADTMVTEVTLHHPGLEVRLHCHEAVDFHEDVYVKEITVENLAPRKRRPGCSSLWISAFRQRHRRHGRVRSENRGRHHYKGARYLLASGLGPDSPGLSQYAVVKRAWRQGRHFRDAEDGLLSGNPWPRDRWIR